MKYINIAEAKKQIVSIAEKIDEPMILVGGIAINQYIHTRQSEDIDLICSDKFSKEIISNLYPTLDWTLEEENDDDYRPAYVIKHKTNREYPTIKFGPKIKERGLYEFINYDDLFEETRPFKYNNKEYQMVKVPSIEYLCYMKIVSFLSRDEKKVEKLKKDIKDIMDLCNTNSFRLGVFLNNIRKNQLEEKIKKNFSYRLKLLNLNFKECNFGILTELFYSCIYDNHSTYLKKTSEEKLVVFDLDGTLIKGIRHSWTLLWDELGIDKTFQQQRKEQFINGDISYLDWVNSDLKILTDNGFNIKTIRTIANSNKCHLTKNIAPAIKKLKQCGYRTAIISGGIDTLLLELLPAANELFDDIYINKFKYDENGTLVSISATEYDWDDSKKGVAGKNRGLERLCEKYLIPIENTVFVGDDLNDFKAMQIAGKKIYYCNGTRHLSKKMPTDITIIPKDDLMLVVNEIIK